jgi:8-oxo-dGTP diphosphatase
MIPQVLVTIVDQNNLILGFKKRGLGQDLFNGFGGHIEEGEYPILAAQRELSEEAKIDVPVQLLNPVGVLDFEGVAEDSIRVFLFILHLEETTISDSEFIETDEMKPMIVKRTEIPWEKMWPDDPHWLPHILRGDIVEGKFTFEDGKLIQTFLKVTGNQKELFPTK